MVFNVVPTAFEVALVAGILAVKCGAPFAALTGATIVAYTAFTFSITQVGLLAGCGLLAGLLAVCVGCSLGDFQLMLLDSLTLQCTQYNVPNNNNMPALCSGAPASGVR
jgi:hypothetical protein